MLEPEDLIQDEIEHPDQTWQLQRSYSPLKADQQSLLRIRTRLLERRSLQMSPSSQDADRQERQSRELPNRPFEQPMAGQFLPPTVAQRPEQAKKKLLRSWRLVALVAVVCAVILSGTVYALHYRSVQTGHPISPQVTPTVLPYKMTSIVGITMTSATAGWGLGDLEQDSQRVHTVVRTTDGGKTWQAFDFHGQPAGLIGSFFLNDQTAWVIMGSSLDAHSKVPLMRTTDGGLHWTALSLPPEMMNMTFLDQQHGWAWSSDELQGVPASRTLYRTMDGGKTWSKLGMTSTERTIDDLTPGPLPFNNGLGMTFLTPQHGWAIVHAFLTPQSFQYVSLYMTQDGGQTWQLQSLPQPANGPIPGIHTVIQGDSQSGAYLAMWPPKFVTAQHGILSIASQVDAQSPRRMYLYETNDRGQSWSLLGTPIEDTSGSQFPEVLDATHILLANLRSHTITVYIQESGQWQQQPSRQITGMMTSLPSFVDQQRGWVWSKQSSGSKIISTLYATNDGGLSWHEVMHMVADIPPRQQGG